MHAATLGGIEVSRVVEIERMKLQPFHLFPDATDEAVAAQRSWLVPQFADADGSLYMNIQAYVVKTRHHTILVDACCGNGKQRPFAHLSNLSTDWLDRLKASGVAPEDVDIVLCTHLHFDHVGWNTRLVDGRWVPTFPNAKVLMARAEWEFWKAEYEAGRDQDGSIGDSVIPIVEAGRAVIVEGDHAVDDQLWLEPTPGHTPGHVCLHAKDGGREAILTGDLLHHPIQLAQPSWCVRACVDRKQSAATRRAFIERNADSDRLILAAHFNAPNGGRIRSAGAAWQFAT